MTNYELVLGKDLKAGDIIIHNGSKCVILSHNFGLGAGSVDFGEYIYVIVRHVNAWLHCDENFWTYQNCPVIRYVGEN